MNKEIYLLLYIKIERIDWFLYTLTLCYIPYSVVIVVMVVSTNWNSDKTHFIAFINCYILSAKTPQTLENAKFIASEFALRLSLVLYPFP